MHYTTTLHSFAHWFLPAVHAARWTSPECYYWQTSGIVEKATMLAANVRLMNVLNGRCGAVIDYHNI